ncbi:MAG: S8 family serine peptidase, partial [Candidatus Aegiribacteria sp.]|nr:S8 family serine peptidase [Candidatus Aegiribacteria sp.]MBD3295408.1 S8 family serine peptidase [Candidatus Fermentibacteria bacterium]
MRTVLSSVVFMLSFSVINTCPGAEDISAVHRPWGQEGSQPLVQGEIIVWFHEDVDSRQITDCLNLYDLSVKSVSTVSPRRMVVSVPAGKERLYAQLYASMDEVLAADVNSIRKILWQPSDPYYYLQWHFNKSDFIDLEEAWNVQQGGDPSIVIAILDTGVAYENYPVPGYEQSEVLGSSYVRASDLSSVSFASPYDFVHDDSHPNDQNGHGTHVCGTIAQDTGDTSIGSYGSRQGYGAAGIAFNCTVMPIQVMSYQGSGTVEDIADGIDWARAHGADVINMSLGGGHNTVEEQAVEAAYNAGMIIVAATGNESADSLLYPAAYAETIAVGSVRYDGTRASYSNYGAGMDVVAPGGDLSVDQNGDGYGDGVLQETFSGMGYYPLEVASFAFLFLDGTSMACPHVAGLVGLMLSNGASPSKVRDILHLTATDLGTSGYDNQYGYGLINCYEAVMASSGIEGEFQPGDPVGIRIQGFNP